MHCPNLLCHYTLGELFNLYKPQQAIGQVGYATLGSAQSSDYTITIDDLKQCNIDKD